MPQSEGSALDISRTLTMRPHGTQTKPNQTRRYFPHQAYSEDDQDEKSRMRRAGHAPVHSVLTGLGQGL